MAVNRDIRKLINTKQDVTEFNGTPSVGGMSDGQIAIAKSNNKQLAIYRKKYGKLWKSYMNHDGNEYVDKNLTVKNDLTINGKVDSKLIIDNGIAKEAVEIKGGTNGDLFLSASNPSVWLIGNSDSETPRFRMHHNSADAYFDCQDDDGSNGTIYFRGDTSIKFQFNLDTEVGTTDTWTSTSDEKLKKNITDLNNGLDTVNKLKAVNFEWKKDSRKDIGLIAQDVIDVIPEVVFSTKSKPASADEGNEEEEYYSIAYGKLVPHLIKAVQELTARLDSLENK